MKTMKVKSITSSIFSFLLSYDVWVFFLGSFFILFYFIICLVKFGIIITAQNQYPPTIDWARLTFGLLIVILSLIYYLSYKLFLANKSLRVVIPCMLIFCVILLLTPPFSSADLFHYVFFPKIVLTYHDNPYISPIINYSHDVFFTSGSIIRMWMNEPLVYGPVWLLLAIIFNFWALKSISLAILSFKLMATVFFIGCLFLVYKISDLVDNRNKIINTSLFAWSPLILFESINNGHNDIIMLFFLLLAVYALVKEKYFWVIPSLFLSFLIKYITIIFLPFFLFYLWHHYSEKEQRKKILLSILLSLIILVSVYLPFWRGFITLKGAFLMSIANNLTMLSTLGCLFAIFYYNLKMNFIFPYLIPLDFINIVCHLVFIYFYFYLLIKFLAKNNINNLFKVCLLVLFLVFLTITSYIQPWYFVTFLGLMIFIKDWPKYWLVLATFFALLNYFYFFNELLFCFLFIVIFCFYYNMFMIKEVRLIKNVIFKDK